MKDLMAALTKARSEMADPRKSANNPAFRSKYVPRDEALDAVMPALLANGLMLVQYPVTDGDTYGVGSKLVHTSGQEMDCGVFTVRPAKNDPQGAVAATTYASRCALMLLFGIAGDEDDDGNHASGKSGGGANAPVRRENAPQATQTTAEVKVPAKASRVAQNAPNSPREVVAQLGKAIIEKGVAPEALAAFVLNAYGKPSAEMGDDELTALAAKLTDAYKVSRGA